MKAKDYNLKWQDYFKYDESSPSGLVWIIPRVFKGTLNYDRVGKPAGSKLKSNNNIYWTVGLSIEGERFTYNIHRIIWVMINGHVEIANDIDHLDGNGLNNKIANLRECSKSINSRNKRLRKDNITGLTSVFYEKTNTSEGYRACVIDHNGVKHRKYFSILKYGEDAKGLAEDWKMNKLEELENAGFTDRHGKEIFQQ